MKQTLLVKNLIMVAIFVFAINVTSAQHENAAATKEEVTTEVKDSSEKEAQATVVDQKFDPNKNLLLTQLSLITLPLESEWHATTPA